MVALTATSSATPSLQRTLLESRLVQAQQAAQRAEAQAKALQSQADAADAEARSQSQTARSLGVQIARLDTTYTHPTARRSTSSTPALTGLLLDVWAR
jgi:hypothetical protein